MRPESLTVSEAEQYLLSRELFGMHFGLERMQRLMTALDSPQLAYDTIHVVGTNGKSSTTRMIGAILEAHGRRAGAYLSPHITGFSERIEVGGRPIGQRTFAAAVARTAGAVEKVERTLDSDDRVTQFEALTAAAFWQLRQSGVQVAAIEAGLGGRYDATSVIDSSVQVLTNVGLEHTRWLGPTLRDIAEEKLAVVPKGGVLVTGPLEGEVAKVAAELDAEWLMAGRDFRELDSVELRVLGSFQRTNFAVACAACERFLGALNVDAVRAVAAELVLPGRLEVVGRDPLVLLDGAHNPSGIEALAGSLNEVVGDRPLTAVVSVLDDKDAARMLELLAPYCAGVIFTRTSHERALSPATLESLNRQLGGPPARVEADPLTALQAARQQAGPEGAVLATGSLYLLSDLRAGGIDVRSEAG